MTTYQHATTSSTPARRKVGPLVHQDIISTKAKLRKLLTDDDRKVIAASGEYARRMIETFDTAIPLQATYNQLLGHYSANRWINGYLTHRDELSQTKTVSASPRPHKKPPRQATPVASAAPVPTANPPASKPTPLVMKDIKHLPGDQSLADREELFRKGFRQEQAEAAKASQPATNETAPANKYDDLTHLTPTEVEEARAEFVRGLKADHTINRMKKSLKEPHKQLIFSPNPTITVAKAEQLRKSLVIARAIHSGLLRIVAAA